MYKIKRVKYLISRSIKEISENGFLSTLKKIKNIFISKNKIDLDILIKDSPENLDDIFIKFGTDKGSLDGKKTYDYIYKNSPKKEFKNYYDWINRKNPNDFKYQLGLDSAPIYNKVFEKRKNENLKILELGVANGHSVASWHHYFKNSTIYALDIKPEYKFFYKSSRIKYFEIDIFDEKKIKLFLKKHGNFDYIIDDSLHEKKAMLYNFKNFYPFLKKGGAYCLEDFRWIDYVISKVVNYNLDNNSNYYVDNKMSISEIFEKIGKKEFFDNNILTKKVLEEFYKTTEKSEVIYQNHPGAAIAIVYKTRD